MARDRDHVAVASRARRDARRLQAAWDTYVAKAQAQAAIEQCPSIWPPSLHDEAPVHCQLLEGHVDRNGTKHRHRVLGTQAVVTW